MTCEHLAHDLDGYVDRELDAESSRAVRDHIGTCAACRRELAERDALSRLVRTAPYYTAPERLRARVLAQPAPSRWAHRVLTWAAAAVLVVSAGIGIGVWQSTERGDARVDEVVDGHVRSLMASHLVDVQSTDQHTVKPWFLGKLDFAPPVVDLAPIGFPLVGGRLDYLEGRPVAAVVYQRGKHTINVFIRPDLDSASAPASVRSVRGFQIHHWIRREMSFWAVSDLNDADLSKFVDALQSS